MPFGRDLEGDSWDFGYNLALHFKPTDNLNLSATYCSEVELTVEGDAKLFVGPSTTVNSGASVSIPVPAALNLAAAYNFDKTTLELVLERTYWSAYDKLDFDYTKDISAEVGGGATGAGLALVMDAAKTKNWSDSNTIRLGLTHEVNDRWTVMAGYAHDETPVPKQYAGYELPDSDAKIYSFGARYKYNDQLTVGAVFLYDDKESLDLIGSGNTNGEALGTLATAKFKDAAAYFLTVGLEYKF